MTEKILLKKIQVNMKRLKQNLYINKINKYIYINFIYS